MVDQAKSAAATPNKASITRQVKTNLKMIDLFKGVQKMCDDNTAVRHQFAEYRDNLKRQLTETTAKRQSLLEYEYFLAAQSMDLDTMDADAADMDESLDTEELNRALAKSELQRPSGAAKVLELLKRNCSHLATLEDLNKIIEHLNLNDADSDDNHGGEDSFTSTTSKIQNSPKAAIANGQQSSNAGEGFVTSPNSSEATEGLMGPGLAGAKHESVMVNEVNVDEDKGSEVQAADGMAKSDDEIQQDGRMTKPGLNMNGKRVHEDDDDDDEA